MHTQKTRLQEIADKVDELSADYSVDEIRSPHTGHIVSLGKFQGQPVEALYWYDAMMNGDGEMIQEYTVFEADADEQQFFGMPKDERFVFLYESNDGFVSISHADIEEYNRFADMPIEDDEQEPA